MKTVNPEPPSTADATAAPSAGAPPPPGGGLPAWQSATAGKLEITWAPGALCLLLDVASWLGICALADWLRLRGGGENTNPTALGTQLLELLVVVIVYFVIGNYDRRRDMRSLSHTSEHFIALLAGAALASLLVYSVSAFDQAMRPSRSVLLGSFLIFGPLSLFYRRIVSGFVNADMVKRVFLVLGAGEIARRFYEAYQQSASCEQLRFVDVTGEAAGRPIAGSGSPVIEGDALGAIDRLGPEIDGVILAEPVAQFSPAVLERLTRLHFLKAPVYTLESFYEAHWRRVPVYVIDPVWPFQMGFQLARNSPYSHIKRLFDVVAAGGALCVLSPLLAALVIGTWLDSGKPALFRQTRVGRNNRPFRLYKFRTMFTQPPGGGPGDLYTRANDKRITSLGKWLRKLRLDELPQLWNVLKGDMSLIGPRAEWDKCAELYEKDIPFYHFRHLVKPGITGWAQVCYPYGQNAEDALQKLKYDLYYIRHYSLRLDAMIVLKTLHIMFWGKGQ